ncbi:MAG TPA: glycosyltransferase family 1 protein [Chloroflexi bacterium]|nr:glycosyltransferase family 1 protein [Chloroflexota bacterium]
MKPIRTFSIIPSLPEPLEPLRELAYNLRWAWNHDTIELFRRLDSDLWESTNHNPLLMLGKIDQQRLTEAVNDAGFMAHFNRVWRDFQAYLDDNENSSWFVRTYGERDQPLIAYFSAEFGVTECLSIFAGGLGVLSGDHLKSASDLGLPLVGVGLLYQQGYFQQYLNQAGWQQEIYADNDFDNLPLRLEKDDQDAPLIITVKISGREVQAQIWRAQVGRVSLYLLDTNLLENRPDDRDITDQLYGGDQEMRIKQEIVLGIGGYRALKALGLEPAVYHVNEGHSAFLALERIRCLMEEKSLTFTQAREAASAGLVFTTHTPVAAGHDRFSPQLMERYFVDYIDQLELSWDDFLALGRVNRHDHQELFCMTVLAMRLASHTNGVSQLHGQVSREMWRSLWPGVAEEEIPITAITNGVHFLSWISRDMKELYDRYLGPRWREEPADQEVWQRAERIAAEELWRTHERRRERLVAFARNRLREHIARRGGSQRDIEAANEVLDPEALTIGFARRFATYKRATLILSDPDRLARFLNNPERPVQLIFAGKAHPRDDPGKELIKEIVALSRQERFRRHIIFLEDYDMTIARYLVQGCDVWLNTPRRPREASGTSGMKATANAVLNLSILDGWWDEAYTPQVGWAIGQGEMYNDRQYQDQVEAEALYELLERNVIPTFYERDQGGLPRRWIDMMKKNISVLCHFFNTNRMVAEYTERFYMPTAERYTRLTAEELTGAKALADWHRRIEQGWSEVRVVSVKAQLPSAEPKVSETIGAEAWVRLGELNPEDVCVELYLGPVDAHGNIIEAQTVAMELSETQDGLYRYVVEAVPCERSGLHGYTVRIIPEHEDMVTSLLPGFIVWAS